VGDAIAQAHESPGDARARDIIHDPALRVPGPIFQDHGDDAQQC
jgi:hypothetical protein